MYVNINVIIGKNDNNVINTKVHSSFLSHSFRFYLLVGCVDGVLPHSRVQYSLTNAVHSFGKVILLLYELRVRHVLGTSSMHAVVRHFVLLFLRHFTFHHHSDQHLVADAFVFICVTCSDGHLRVGFHFAIAVFRIRDFRF